MTLALEMDRKYAEGRAEGKAEGKAEGILKTALASVRNLVTKNNMSPQDAIDLLGYDKELSAKLMPLLK